VIRIVIALVLLAHGIGHSMGLLQMLKVSVVNPGWQGDSWLLTGSAGTTITQVVGIGLWSAAIVGFAALAGTVVGWLPAAWFTPLAIAAPLASLAGLFLFPLAFPAFSTLGALVVDVAVLLAAVWYHWLPTDLAA
jgi:hypothetical protein